MASCDLYKPKAAYQQDGTFHPTAHGYCLCWDNICCEFTLYWPEPNACLLIKTTELFFISFYYIMQSKWSPITHSSKTAIERNIKHLLTYKVIACDKAKQTFSPKWWINSSHKTHWKGIWLAQTQTHSDNTLIFLMYQESSKLEWRQSPDPEIWPANVC